MVPATQQPGVTITSNVVGAPFTLDGGSDVHRARHFLLGCRSAAHHRVAQFHRDSQPGARYVFQSWADGGANPRTITVPAVSTHLYCNRFRHSIKLTLSASPPTAGGIVATPASIDGYYNAGAIISLNAIASPGYNFWYFSGDASGNTLPASLTMSAPRSVTSANF